MEMKPIELHSFVDELKELKIHEAQDTIVDKIFNFNFVQLLWEKIYLSTKSPTLAENLNCKSEEEASTRLMNEISQGYDICRRISHDPETLMGSCVKAGIVKLEKELSNHLQGNPIPGVNNDGRFKKKLLESVFGAFSEDQFLNEFNPSVYPENNEKNKLIRFSKYHRAWNLKPINEISEKILVKIIAGHAAKFNPEHQTAMETNIKMAVDQSIKILQINFFQALDNNNALRFVETVFDNCDLEPQPYEQMIRAIALIFSDCMDVIHEGWAPRVVANGKANWYFGPKSGDIHWQKHVEWIENNGPRLGKPEIELLDETTTEILNLITDPGHLRFPTIHCKGLVVGYVQSGKTASYSALIAKAIDCGYKNIIVLTGTLENLRKQTQDRICRDLFGIFPAGNQNPADPGPEINAAKRHFVRRTQNGNLDPLCTGIGFLTRTNVGDGDFKINSGEFSNGRINIAVTKKNHATLGWCLIKSANARDQPTLIIDDEADQASVALRTRQGFAAAAGVNQAVRMLLEGFTRASYVAYTATPFANMLTCLKPANFPMTNDGNIDFKKIRGLQNAKQDRINFFTEYFNDVKKMNSLYPKDFIYNLPDPTKSGYMGSERFFGVPEEFINLGTCTLNAWKKIENDEASAIRQVDQNNTNADGDFPSLREAITWFLMATAIRKIREKIERDKGVNKPDLISSMMVHASAKTVTHAGMTAICERITLQICQQVNNPHFKETLHEVYNVNYSESRAEMLGKLSSWEAVLCVDIPFEDIYCKLGELFGHIHDKSALDKDFNFPCDNSTIDSVRILYDRNAPGFKNFIIVNGGNTLTRGLTLEGLVVSHFTRESKQMDTLLQMGRWFGYRIGYHDLCKVYTTESIADKFMRLTVVENMIREDIEKYRIKGMTPADVGVRIPLMDDLKICGSNRMGDVVISRGDQFSKPSQTIIFKKNDMNWLRKNWDAGVELIRSIKNETSPRPGRDWNVKVFGNVSLKHIKTFLGNYKTVRNARRFDSQAILNYLESVEGTEDMQILNLNHWNVVLMGLDPQSIVDGRKCDFGGYEVGMVNRSRIVNDVHAEGSQNSQSNSYEATIGTLISPKDPFIDIPNEPDPPAGGENYVGSEARFTRYNYNIPLLILYPIWKDSAPMQRVNTKVVRKGLEAVHNILGASILLPPLLASDSLIDNFAMVNINMDNDLDTEEQADLDNQNAAQQAAQQAKEN